MELLVVLAVAAALAAVAIGRAAPLLAGISVREAEREVVAAFATARHAAIARGVPATVRVDQTTGRVVVSTEGETLLVAPLARRHGVTVRASIEATTYAATGLGWGAANGRILLTRGAAAETVTVSRLGRVRW